MNYSLLKDIISLTEKFEAANNTNNYSHNLDGFKSWFTNELQSENTMPVVEWEGKKEGRSPESVINTLINHLSNYAKNYSKAAIADSDFSTQEEFIYLINLKAFGSMGKTKLIRKNIHDKPLGMQIIKRLLQQGWVKQEDSKTDKRSKVVSITPEGLIALENQMDKIRIASQIVTGDLTQHEKMELIRLLNKLDAFHNPIYKKNIDSENLLDYATINLKTLQN